MMLRYCFNKITDIVLDLIYPKHCAICSKTILGYTKEALCLDCAKSDVRANCVRDDRFSFDESLSVLKYEGTVKENMLKYKFKSVKYFSKAYACLIDKAVIDRPYLKDAILCPVPLSFGREREYNQTALIAKELSKMWKSEYIEDLLYKCREVKPLSKMKLYERKFYIGGAINVNPVYDIMGKSVVIIDDIFTSGTTTDECAKMLKLYGAQNVYVLCACYD